MLTQEVTKEMIAEWKAVSREYRPRLTPNRKNAVQIIDYLQARYPVVELSDKTWQQIVIDDVVENEALAEKLPLGATARARVFSVRNTGAGKTLFDSQDALFHGLDIIVGVELETGHFHVEGSSALFDELFAFRGLDQIDLENYFLVAEYISCLKKQGLLKRALSRTESPACF